MNYVNVTVIAYSILLIVGGIIGHQVKGSLASLIASVASGTLLLLALYVMRRAPKLGITAIVGIVALLSLFFSYRWIATQHFMPPGLLALISFSVLGILFCGCCNSCKCSNTK